MGYGTAYCLWPRASRPIDAELPERALSHPATDRPLKTFALCRVRHASSPQRHEPPDTTEPPTPLCLRARRSACMPRWLLVRIRALKVLRNDLSSKAMIKSSPVFGSLERRACAHAGVQMCMRACTCVCERASKRACACACLCVCVRACLGISVRHFEPASLNQLEHEFAELYQRPARECVCAHVCDEHV